ncbi:MAG: ABC transporter ATP-binding protein [Acidobacteria bacterium]|nr:ABC transporter ATP-binding protein [Thermoanaerobaculia bacterium]NLN10499.1 ABC transporter ATP-binding protein [Acidobacteriota bacterium]MBP7814243.1 ABC transporter ATP-binding protein [Thermoanaerobaculia bacterium]HPA96444.1 ABC transporter ATP-binding protein [Thermoanaerobaculia bacterium]HQN39471.1 ABC transporter ATP-binding protein [Thermoanaerobaculia bacterium]
MQIETRGLIRRFGSVVALAGVDLTIPSGLRIGLVGPNGSGKSTLLRVLMGLLEHEGEVRVGGFDPRRQRLELARQLAYVPQIAPALAASVTELARAVEALRDLDLAELRTRAEALGLRWSAIANVPLRALSGGMRQKLLVALALSARAGLLVLDEPTASLDAATRETFFHMFGELPATTTSILCSHRLDEMRHLVDHVVSLEEGHVRFDGPAANYLATRALSVIEVQLAAGADSGWLDDLGFAAGHAGWWRRTVAQREKVELLPRLAGMLDGRLVNLHVRDLESIAVDESREGS